MCSGTPQDEFSDLSHIWQGATRWPAQQLGLKDDREILDKEFIVYKALYAYCRQRVRAVEFGRQS